MIRQNTYTIEEILSKVSCSKKKILLDDDLMNFSSNRLRLFKAKGTACICCGLKAKFFAKERHENSTYFSLNLYGVDKNSREILMTRDHWIPRSKHGRDVISNLQPMCQRCNSVKADKIITDIQTIKVKMIKRYKKHNFLEKLFRKIKSKILYSHNMVKYGLHLKYTELYDCRETV